MDLDPTTQPAIRALRPSDLSFIYATWLRQIVMGYCVGLEPSTSSRAVYHRHKRIIDGILSRSATLVATLPDDSDVILGYLVVEKLADPDARPVIHWAYTKGPWRGMGVARLLFGELDPQRCVCSHLAKAVDLCKWPGLVFDPRSVR